MAEYELTITRRDPNPNYVPARNAYEYNKQEVDQYLSVRQVTATLTQAEYDALKRALIEHWAK